MRIAIFSDTFVPEVNGVARTLKRYTDYLEEQGIEYQLFVPNSQDAIPEVPHVQRFTSIPFFLYSECRLAFAKPNDIKQKLIDFQPDLIHIATPFNLGLLGSYYGKKLNIPIVASYHTHFDHYLQYYHLSFLKNWIWKYMSWFHRPFKKVFVPSKSTKEKLISRNFHPNIDIWGRGVNHHFYTPKKRTDTIRAKYSIKEKNILLFVGRLAPEKNISMVMDTYHNLPESIKKETHLLIVGDGPLYKSLMKEKTEHMTLTGFLDGEALAEVYASSDLFLFPSNTETFGNVVLEAMASGLPVIGAKEGGVKNLIADKENGYLCRPNDLQDFVNKTTRLIEDESLRNQMAHHARLFALTQSWDAIFNDLILACQDVIYEEDRVEKYPA